MSYVRTAHFRMTLFVFICVSVGAAISIKSLIILNCPVFIGMERLEELFSFSEQESYQLQVTPPPLDSSESRESFQYGYISYKLPVNVFPFIQCRNENKPYSGTQAQDKSKMINQSW